MTRATTARKRVVERYIEGFRANDRETILGCLTDDGTWEMPPSFELSGRTAFENAIENDASPGLPDIQLTRLVEEGDVVVAEAPYRPRSRTAAGSTRCSATSSTSVTTGSGAS